MVEKITVKTKILVYLSDYLNFKDRYIYPNEITQEGIARAIGITVTHVPRELDDLLERGLVMEIKGRVKDKEKRVNVYFLTPSGIMEVERIKNSIGSIKIEYNKRKVRLSDMVEKYGKMTWLQAIEIAKNNHKNNERKNYIEGFLKIDLLDRKNEIKSLKKWLKSDVKYLVIRGEKGSGKTSLISKFISLIKDWNVIMVQMDNVKDLKSFKDRVQNGMNERIDKILKRKNLIILDNYSDDKKEILDYLIKKISKKSKIIVSTSSTFTDDNIKDKIETLYIDTIKKE